MAGWSKSPAHHQGRCAVSGCTGNGAFRVTENRKHWMDAITDHGKWPLTGGKKFKKLHVICESHFVDSGMSLDVRKDDVAKLMCLKCSIICSTLVLSANGLNSNYTREGKKVDKRAHLEALLDYCNPDAIIISETKLDGEISCSEVLPQGYLGNKPLRCDRNRHGGGVLIAVKDCYTLTESCPTTLLK